MPAGPQPPRSHTHTHTHTHTHLQGPVVLQQLAARAQHPSRPQPPMVVLVAVGSSLRAGTLHARAAAGGNPLRELHNLMRQQPLPRCEATVFFLGARLRLELGSGGVGKAG